MKTLFLIFLTVFSTRILADPSDYPGLAKWLFYEQHRMETTVDPEKIVSPEMSALPFQYRPESGKTFLLPSLWVPAGDWLSFRSHQIPASVLEDVEKREGEKDFFRLFVHPLSMKLYKPLIDKYGLVSEHLATPTSSARTLLVFPQNSTEPYFTKVSLDVVLATSKRTIPAEEVIRSVGMSDYVSKQRDLHPGLSLIPDSYGIVPSDMSRSGQLIRPIPPSVLSSESLPIPLFSLYSPDSSGTTLFQKWVKKSGLSPLEAAQKFITEPFAKAWTQWALTGLSHEAHAQNVLIEVDPHSEMPTGKFFIRDAGGLFLNPKAHRVSKEHLTSLPAPNGFFWDYQKWADTAENTSLHIYFVGGVLFNLERELRKAEPKYKPGSLEAAFYSEVGRQISLRTNLSPELINEKALKHKMNEVLKLARESEAGVPTPTLGEKLGRPLRIGFYSGTFDPPHKGHLDLLEAAIAEKNLDMVIVSPNVLPPSKPGASPYLVRRKMAEMIFNKPKMTLVWDGFESASFLEGSDGVLRKMMNHYESETQIYRIVGDDSFDWFHQSGVGVTDPRLVYLVSQRDPSKGSLFPTSIRQSPVEVLRFRGEGLSSSLIREQIRRGAPSPALPSSIHHYIQSKSLYTCDKPLARISKTNR